MDLTPFPGPAAVPPEVPGFQLHEMLGFGAHGEVWRAEDLVTGDPVALKIGHLRPVPATFLAGNSGGTDVFGREAEVARLCRIEHPHIAGLRRVVPLADGRLALVLDLAEGGSLASLVATRGRLSSEEVVTLVIPLASALEHLHRRGLTHGDIAPGNVLLTAGGRPQLGDLGAARLLGMRGEEGWGTPGFTDPAVVEALGSGGPVPVEVLRAADLWALAAACWFALTGGPPGAMGADPDPRGDLYRLLARCLAPEQVGRPGPAELAELAWEVARPAPIRRGPREDLAYVSGSGAEGGDSGAGHSRGAAAAGQGQVKGGSTTRGPRGAARPARGGPARVGPTSRRAVPVTRLLALLVATAAVGAVTAGVGRQVVQGAGSVGAQGDPGTGRPGEPLDAELAEALTRIGRARSEAFETVSRRRLAEADASGSPAEQADRGLLRRLRHQGYRLEDLTYRIGRVDVLTVEGPTVEVAAEVSATAHRQVRGSDGAFAEVPATGPASMVFTLSATGTAAAGAGRWLLHDIRGKA
ncbi:protein kinase [Kineosporia sp. J2-2]|uniref:non-specific serine/threonine protein kinase n=1 Tax=Kineosporia corallincola TaxID=2835133 RepID=A0ABS5TIR7_9ACTN|nr:protein kinase [Kineosporia corallincola]MBT0770988.1 protein kinase [Kineosporia corallincola]